MAFSLAAILVVPIALVLAQWFGWQSPFLLFGVCGLLLALLCATLLPSLPVSRAPHGSGLRQLLASPLCQGALFILCLQMFGHFLLIPHFANYFQFNLAFPREQIAALYLCGGLASMATMRLCGSWIDQGRAQAAILITSLLLALITLLGFAMPVGVPVYLLFTLFMALSSARSSTTLAITASIPAPHQRAAFMSFQGTVTNVAVGSAACSPPGCWCRMRAACCTDLPIWPGSISAAACWPAAVSGSCSRGWHRQGITITPSLAPPDKEVSEPPAPEPDPITSVLFMEF